MQTERQRRYMVIEKALKEGDMATLRQSSSGEADFPNVRASLTGAPLLELAISWSPLGFVRGLLRLGGSANYDSSSDGYPSVYAAIDSEHQDRYDLAEFLLEFGANVNERGFNGHTPLHVALSNCDATAIALLLRKGPDPNLRTRIDQYAGPLEEAMFLGGFPSNFQGAAMLSRLLEQ